MATYTNSFYNKNRPNSYQNLSGEFIESYKGYDLYRASTIEYHIVKDGVCLGMRAGINGCKREIDNPMYLKA